MAWAFHHELGIIWHHKVGHGVKQQSIIKWKCIYVIRPEKVLKAQASYMKNCPNALGLYSCYNSVCCQVCIHSLMVCPMIDSLRKRINVGYWWFCMLCRYYPEVDSFRIAAPSWNNPKRHLWKEIFPVGGTLDSTYVHTFCLDKEIVRCVSVHWLMAYSQ